MGLHIFCKMVLGLLLSCCLFSTETQSLVVRGTEGPGDACEITNGVWGRCIDNRLCRRRGGVVRRNGIIKLCAKSDDYVVYVCCRKPFEIANTLCRTWKSYWHKNGGRCVYKNPLVVGGKEAGVGQFPEIAILGIQMRNRQSWMCGATLLSPHFVLTAAHCVYRKYDYVLRFGEHNLYSRETTNISRIIGAVPRGIFGEVDLRFEHRNIQPVEQTVRVRRVIIHPEYVNENKYNDIALLQLERPVVLTERVLPACLPVNPQEKFMNLRLTVAGWGMTAYGAADLSETLQMVKIPIIDQRECSQEIRDRSPFLIKDKGLLSRQLCAGKERMNSCKGDSGGPMVIQMRNRPRSTPCEHTVAGVVSLGLGCGRISVYTRVSSYLDWITGYIAPKVIPH